jgi:hypothetical protein
MAIKRRPSIDPAKEAAIEAFGEAAERPVISGESGPGYPKTVAVPNTAPARTDQHVDHWPRDIAKTLLIRYPDLELPTMLGEVARLEERSQHATAVRALRRGLEVLKRENNA